MTLPTIDDYPRQHRYRFCPIDGSPLERRTVHGIERLTCPTCNWVFYPAPNIAATVIVEYRGGIVLAQRATEPDRGMWHLPIGHAEFGEAPEVAAARETYEETGLEVTDLQFLTYTHSIGYGDPRMWYLVFSYVGRATAGTLTLSDEVSALEVVPLAELPEMKWNSQRRAIAVYRKRLQKS